MILDIICLVIILIALLIGVVKGLFKMAARLVSIILALITACCFTGTATNFLYDNFLAPKVGEMVDTKIEEMGAQEAAESIYTTVTEIQVGIAQLQGGEVPDALKESVTRAQNFGSQASESLYSVGIDVNAIGEKIGETGSKTIDAVKNSDIFKGIQSKYNEVSEWVSGFGSGIIANAAGDINLAEMDSILDKVESLNPIQKADPNVNSQIAQALTGVIKGPVIAFITPLCFVIINILGIIIYGIILSLIAGLLEKIKLIDKVQKIGGGIIGIFVGAGLAFAIVMILPIFITPGNELYYVLDGSVSLKLAEELKLALSDIKLDASLLDSIGMKVQSK